MVQALPVRYAAAERPAFRPAIEPGQPQAVVQLEFELAAVRLRLQQVQRQPIEPQVAAPAHARQD